MRDLAIKARFYFWRAVCNVMHRVSFGGVAHRFAMGRFARVLGSALGSGWLIAPPGWAKAAGLER